MKIQAISKTCSILLIALGAMVLCGWIFHIPQMVQVIPGLVGMVGNTACLFILSGILLIIFSRPSFRYQTFVEFFICSVIFIVALLSLSQDIFAYDLGIDRILFSPWLNDPNPTPGRMAPNTAIGFIITAVIGFLMPYGEKKSVAILIQLLTFLILIIALLGLLVYSLKLEFIFSWYRYTRMAVHTALGFLVLSIGWWTTWSKSAWCKKFYQGKEDKKIIFVTGIILFCLTLLAGLGGIAALTYMNVSSVNKSLQNSLENKILLLTSSISSLRQNMANALSNSLVIEAIEKNNLSNEEVAKQISIFLTSKGFSAIQITDKQGKVLLDSGNFIKSNFSIPLNLPDKNQLLWKNGFWFRVNMPIVSGSQTLGYFLGETSLSVFNHAYFDYQGLGSTGETLLCTKGNNKNAYCFPSRFTPHPFIISLASNRPVPIYYALAGDQGTLNIIDYHKKNVIAAFNSVDQLGLGMVVKIETKEIYQPINDQLKIFLPIAIFFIFSGLILLYWQVVPLVRKVIFSERAANESKIQLLEANLKLESSLDELHVRNLEISQLKELSATLPSCINMQEAEEIIAKYAKRLMPDSRGILYLLHISHQYLEAFVTWGKPHLTKKIFSPEECWALRRGTLHHVADPNKDLICLHSKESSTIPSYICIPLLAQGDVTGLLYLESSEFKYENPLGSEQENEKLLLPVTFAEQIALGISNIKLRETLRNESLHDPLTGLYNRRYLEETLERELLRMNRNELPLSLLMLDIDHFKKINDEFGHDAGDIVLKALGQLFTDQIRAHDFACRYGGEEFVFIIPGADLDTAMSRAEEIRNAVQRLQIHYGSKLLGPITLSIGIAAYPSHAKEAQDLITAADLALYHAKNTGRNKIVTYVDSLSVNRYKDLLNKS